ncbi:MAG TPA: DNA primase [Woeseiaceae bacterium]
MSGLIPQHFIDDLIARADVVEVIGKRVPLRKAGREYKAPCPFHEEKTPSFTVSPAKGFYHCFGCGAHGTALGFLMEYEHLSFPEAVETLAHAMGLEVPRDESQRPARRHDELFRLMEDVQKHYAARLAAHRPALDYLSGRGIDAATAARYGLGYAPAGWSDVLDRFGRSPEGVLRLLAAGLVIRRDTGSHYDRFRDRLMFPIRDARGRVIGFGGRVLGEGEPKYLNSPETALFHKGRELYGLFEARQALRSIDRLVVVEGYMDVVGLARHGIDFAVATLGTATTEEHLNRLFRLTDDVAFCFDGDRAGRAAAWRALETALPQVREGRQIRFVFLPEGQDPDSFVRQAGAAAFEAELDHGIALSEFFIEELAGRVDPGSVEGNARLAELARPLLARVPAGVFRELLLQQLAGRIGLPQDRLAALLAGEAGTRTGARPSPGARRPRLKPAAGKPSVVRRAITLLLHYPEAGHDLDVERLAGLRRPGADLLRDLVETVQAHPDITTAGLLERWRHDPQGQHLGRLAAVELPATEGFDPAAELAECVHQLEAAAARERAQFLIEKQRDGTASAAERSELARLVGERRSALN